MTTDHSLSIDITVSIQRIRIRCFKATAGAATKSAAVTTAATSKLTSPTKMSPPPDGELSTQCADLVALGDPADVFAAYESALGTGILASQLKKVEKGFNMKVRLFSEARSEAILDDV